MPKDTEVFRKYFEKLGLESEIADLYLTLHAYGPQTITGLARLAKVERTRVYRLLDTLTSTNLVELENQYKRVILHAAPITNLQILLTQREQEVRDLQDELLVMHGKLTNSPHNHLTRVQFYRGPEGNKQMHWNQTKAKGETVVILYETMQINTNMAFFERWVRKCNSRGQKFRGLVGDHFMEGLQAWYDTHSNERLVHW
ncbi:MAG TPA: helix-turn-helix domain-containing protein, partial [Candidatus Saccharimonadales bacterium]|nr:helix-turn-helix domain-containing protein [Candidatus Saccharimonadales bacterium]